MTLIVGLGNPGKKFEKTRHNIGFRVLDEFQKENDFPEFKFSKKFNSLISEDRISGKKIILAKPQTFMNESGKAVKALVKAQGARYKGQRVSLIVVHDDIDLPLGKVKISQNRGSAGHKGIESIINALGTKNFTRFRIGIHPKTICIDAALHRCKKKAEDMVLKNFTEKEEKIIKKTIKKTCQELKAVISER